jgi:hypothetical protein
VSSCSNWFSSSGISSIAFSKVKKQSMNPWRSTTLEWISRDMHGTGQEKIPAVHRYHMTASKFQVMMMILKSQNIPMKEGEAVTSLNI